MFFLLHTYVVSSALILSNQHIEKALVLHAS